MAKNISRGRRRIRRYKYIFLVIGKAINRNSFVKKFARHFPKTFRFISARFSLYNFSGLPLTFLFLAAYANLMIFNELAETIVNSDGVVVLDNNIAEYFYKVRTNSIVVPIYYFSMLGSAPFVITFALIAIGVSVYFKRYAYVIAILIVILGTGLTIYLGKNYFQRDRPGIIEYYQASSFSFPSGHSIGAVAFYGLIFYFIIRNVKKHYTMSISAASFFILMIGFSRIYLCVHYFTDVIAGFSLGFLWLMLAISIVEWENTKGVE